LQVREQGSAETLYQDESRLWGKAADKTGAGRSVVEISVHSIRPGTIDRGTSAAEGPGAYALWPARPPREGGGAAPSRLKGVRFTLTIVVSSSDADLQAVRAALRAWVLFGGYGSRTRRGVGSLTVRGPDPASWLPKMDAEDDTGEELAVSLHALFSPRLFATPSAKTDYPSLQGATLLVGALERDGEAAWHTALSWLQRFRQAPVGRDPRPRGMPPGQSRWPEADKLRLLTNRTGHPPRYTDKTAAWPRADFGLPIVGRFKDRGEPRDFTLTWHDGKDQRDRMASPVIVKALPTRQGYRPCVLWLSRNHPPGQVIAIDTGTRNSPARFPAAFGSVGTAADHHQARKLHSPLAGKSSVKEAFLDWVRTHKDVVQVPL